MLAEAGGVFQEASREFEDSEGDLRSPGMEPPEALRPAAPSDAEVASAVRDMQRLMGLFGLGLEAVTQAFLKNSGELEAVESCLRTGRRSDGRPLWTRRDDAELREGGRGLRARLEARYGPENVGRREAFRRS
ncbi:telomeric repeat-binding factor 2-interacting protein 1 [Sceloporus undulatus]|uniref:telomeric repeat-binding factor 2-interacting protein 1 n=1 Tax=Sceloporus undulatus TaxID=8520 RepID=UPI001C4DD011|nr:telomeric repeat-binding factor 2-interacting protein 1 [Sceloporus undulatus]